MMMLITRLYSIFGKIGLCYVTHVKTHIHQSSIMDVPGILGQCLDGLHAVSGWTTI